MTRSRIMSTICLLLCTRAGAVAEEWIDSTGKYKVEAELVDFDARTARLKRTADGKILTISLAKLSDADREYLRSLGSPEDYRAIKKLCAEIQRTWLDSPSVDTAWPEDFVCFVDDTPNAPPSALNWEKTVESAKRFLGPDGPFAEVVSTDQPAAWQANGPMALIRVPLAKVRPRGAKSWSPVEMLTVAIRREGKWRVAAAVPGDWWLDDDDVFNPELKDHREIRNFYAQSERAQENGDVDLMVSLGHPKSRLFAVVGPDRPLVGHPEGAREATSQLFAARPVKKCSYELRYIRTQGPIALAVADARLVLESDQKSTHVSIDVLCRTEEGWRVALILAGDWQRILLKNSPQAAPSTSSDASQGPARKRGYHP